MHDRYTLTLKENELALTLGVEVSSEYAPLFNAAPTQRLPVITSHENQRLSFFYWGLMSKWSNNKTMSPKFYNLPLESVINKPSYRRKLSTHRCIVPMDGFYVWKQVAKKQQVPHYFYFPDHRVFAVAALWESYGEEDESDTFIMITKPASGIISAYSDDMPAIIDISKTRLWLDSEDLSDIESFFQNGNTDDLNQHTVTPRIRDISLNDVSFTEPTPASDQFGNYTLFT